MEALGEEKHRELSAPPRPPGFSPEHGFLASLNGVACRAKGKAASQHATLEKDPQNPESGAQPSSPTLGLPGLRDRSRRSTDGRRSGGRAWQPFLPLPAPKLCFLFVFIFQCSQTLDFKGKCGIFQCQKFKPEF